MKTGPVSTSNLQHAVMSTTAHMARHTATMTSLGSLPTGHETLKHLLPDAWMSHLQRLCSCYSLACLHGHASLVSPLPHLNDTFAKAEHMIWPLASQSCNTLTTPIPVRIGSIPVCQPDPDSGRRQSYMAILLNRLLVHLTSHPSSTPWWLYYHH